jgi:hypothetical protein
MSQFKQGDIVSFQWAGRTIEGIFSHTEELGLLNRVCGIVDTEAKGVVQVHIEMLEKVK